MLPKIVEVEFVTESDRAHFDQVVIDRLGFEWCQVLAEWAIISILGPVVGLGAALLVVWVSDAQKLFEPIASVAAVAWVAGVAWWEWRRRLRGPQRVVSMRGTIQSWNGRTPTDREGAFQKAFLIAGIGAVVWSGLIGISREGMLIALLVCEGATIPFLGVFVVARGAYRRQIRWGTVGAMGVAAFNVFHLGSLVHFR